MPDNHQNEDVVPLQFALPSTVSAQWQEAFRRMVAEVMKAGGLQPPPRSHDVREWTAFAERGNAISEALAAPVLARLGTHIVERELGGVRVLEYIPGTQRHESARVLYVHGGGYVGGSARANAVAPAVIANLLEESVLSIDYMPAPRGRYDTVTDEVVAVFESLAKAGTAIDKTALFGDSAGGGIAAAATLKLRDLGRPMPAALALWSPSVDLCFAGDTIRTLRQVDYLDPEQLALNVDMYAGPDELLHPYASPIQGDFGKGFPPTLIQAGTREMLLSDAVRLYQALDAAGCVVKLDIYEGMPHVHQTWPTGIDSPEAALACKKTAQFLQQALRHD